MEADDLAPVDVEFVAGLAVHEGVVPEAAHEHVVGGFLAEVHEAIVVEQDVVEDEHLLAVRGAVVVRARR